MSVPNAPELLKLRTTIDFIEKLNGGWDQRIRTSEVRKVLDLLTEGHLFIGSVLNDGTTFLRGRVLHTKQAFDDVKYLISRNAADVTEFGRCNFPGESVLYASLNLETVLSELSARIDDWVQLVTIRKKPSVELMCTIVGEIDYVRRHGKSSLSDTGFADEIRRHWASLDELQRIRLNLTDAFVAERFRSVVKNPFDYKVTAAFSSIVFSQGIDAFYYPSVGHLGGWNIAISNEAFHRAFEVVSSEVIEINDSLGYGMFGSRTVQKSEEIKGTQIQLGNILETIVFQSFNELLLHQMTFQTPRVALFQVLKMVEGDFTCEPSMPPNMDNNLDRMVLQPTINGSFPLTFREDFSSLSAFINENTDSWDYVACKVVSHGSPEELDKELTVFVEMVLAGDRDSFLFDKNGQGIASIASGRAIPITSTS